MSDTWANLSVFESTDLVNRSYQARNIVIRDGKAAEVVSHLAQSHEYFMSAREASELIRPLLMFYGVLSGARALILFSNPSLREANLQGADGLKAVGWGTELATGIAQTPELAVRITNGTFSELAAATENTERFTINTQPKRLVAWPAEASRSTTTEEMAGTYRLKDLLARLPDLAPIYERTFDEHSACYRADIQVSQDQLAWVIALRDHKRWPLAEPEITGKLRLNPGIHVREELRPQAGQKARFLVYDLTGTDPYEAMAQAPLIKNDEDGRIFVVAPEGDNDFSTLLLLYFASYCLGMLARYHPTSWMALLSRAKGDFAYPLLRATTNLIDRRFPELLLREFQQITEERP